MVHLNTAPDADIAQRARPFLLLRLTLIINTSDLLLASVTPPSLSVGLALLDRRPR